MIWSAGWWMSFSTQTSSMTTPWCILQLCLWTCVWGQKVQAWDVRASVCIFLCFLVWSINTDGCVLQVNGSVQRTPSMCWRFLLISSDMRTTRYFKHLSGLAKLPTSAMHWQTPLINTCVCATFSPSDLALCQWCPVQYPVYSLCETGSQRNGKITKTTTSMEQEDKKKLFILFCHRKYSLYRGGQKKKVSEEKIPDWIHPVWRTLFQHW